MLTHCPNCNHCFCPDATGELDCPACGYPDGIDRNEDWSQEDEDRERLEEEMQCATDCGCGAWIFTPKGPEHIADCVCGAD